MKSNKYAWPNNRQVAYTKLEGLILLPVGWEFNGKHRLSVAEVSTVCLEGGHLEDVTGICDPEHGFETMIFLDGSSISGVFKQHYKTAKKAKIGHRKIVKALTTFPYDSDALPIGPKLNFAAMKKVSGQATDKKKESDGLQSQGLKSDGLLDSGLIKALDAAFAPKTLNVPLENPSSQHLPNG